MTEQRRMTDLAETWPPCRRPGCGHPALTHEHYRDGFDCGVCGRQVCPDYLGPTLGSRLAAWWRARTTRD